MLVLLVFVRGYICYGWTGFFIVLMLNGIKYISTTHVIYWNK